MLEINFEFQISLYLKKRVIYETVPLAASEIREWLCIHNYRMTHNPCPVSIYNLLVSDGQGIWDSLLFSPSSLTEFRAVNHYKSWSFHAHLVFVCVWGGGGWLGKDAGLAIFHRMIIFSPILFANKQVLRK